MQEEETHKKPRLKKPVKAGIAIVLLLFATGIFTDTYVRAANAPSLQAIAQNQEKIQQEVDEIKTDLKKLRQAQESGNVSAADLAKIKSQLSALQQLKNNANVLGITDLTATAEATLTAGFVTLKNTFAISNVHGNKSANSPIVGQIKRGIVYEYTKNEDNFYYISLSSSQKGWIANQYVYETNK